MQQQPGSAAYYPAGQPPPYTAAPGPTVVQATVVPTLIVGSNVGSQPAIIVCRACTAQIVTRVEYIPSMRTHLTAALLCLFGCWPCVCVPYCIDTCNNINHYCPNCNAYIGTHVN